VKNSTKNVPGGRGSLGVQGEKISEIAKMGPEKQNLFNSLREFRVMSKAGKMANRREEKSVPLEISAFATRVLQAPVGGGARGWSAREGGRKATLTSNQLKTKYRGEETRRVESVRSHGDAGTIPTTWAKQAPTGRNRGTNGASKDNPKTRRGPT